MGSACPGLLLADKRADTAWDADGVARRSGYLRRGRERRAGNTSSQARAARADSQVFYLLPSLYDQARAIVDFAVARPTPRRPRFAVIYGESVFDRDVLEGIRSQAALQEVEIVSAERDTPATMAAILAAHPDYLVFSGDSAGLVRIARSLDQASPSTVLVSFISTVQDGVSQLPPRVAEHALFAAPAPPLDAQRASAFFSLSPAGNSSQNSYLGLRAAAFAAGDVLVQALRASGSRPTRSALVHTLERLQHFETGVTAPLTFGPNQHVGSSGAIMLAIDPTNHGLVAVSGWITPKI